MTDESKLSQAAAKGARAARLLADDLQSEGYDRIEADLVAAWIASDPRDKEGREMCFHAVHANRKHKVFMESVISNGKLADADLRALMETAERKKRFGII